MTNSSDNNANKTGRKVRLSSGAIGEGWHPATLESLDESVSKAGNDVFIFGFRLDNRRKILRWVMPWQLMGFLASMGVEVDTDADTLDTSEVVGRRVLVEIGTDTYQGNSREVVRAVSPVPDDGVA